MHEFILMKAENWITIKLCKKTQDHFYQFSECWLVSLVCNYLPHFSRYLQQNLLSKLENLEHLEFLDTLNVSNNTISKIENIGEFIHM